MNETMKKTWVENTILLDKETDLIIVVEHTYSRDESEGLKIHSKYGTFNFDHFHPYLEKKFQNEFEIIGSW